MVFGVHTAYVHELNRPVTIPRLCRGMVTFEDYWQPFLGGQGPAPAYAMSLDETTRARLRDRLQARIPVQTDGSISLTAGPGQSAQPLQNKSAQRW